MLFKFEVVDKKYGINFNESKHYNIITPFIPYQNIVISHTIKYLLFSLTIYYVSYLLHTT
jgi:hypothetical protein